MPFRTTSGAVAGFLASLLLISACGDTETSRAHTGMRVIAGRTNTDSVQASFPRIIAELRDDNGAVLPGVDVQISINKLTNSPLRFGGTQPAGFVSGQGFQLDAATNGPAFVTVKTDVNGQIAAFMRAFQNAGVAQIVFNVPSRNTADTASLTIRAGDPVSLRAFPADTVVYVQRSYTLHGAVIDQFGNDAIGNFPVTYTALDNAVSVSATGVVTGVAGGRTGIIARSAARIDTAEVTVVPVVGTFAIGTGTQFGSRTFDIGVMGLDGSGVRKLATTLGYTLKEFDSYGDDWYMRSQWMPDGNALIVESSRIVGVPRLWYVPVDGSAPRRLMPLSTATAETWPATSADGPWVYYTRSPERLIRRVHPDGSGDEALPPARPAADPMEVRGAVSRDGVWLAWNNDTPLVPHLSTRRISTGERTALSIDGISPAWSPTENRLAYIVVSNAQGVRRALRTVSFDGTNDQLVADDNFDGPMSWSPDGRFILAMRRLSGGQSSLEVIEVSTGKRFPLRYTSGMLNSSWRP